MTSLSRRTATAGLLTLTLLGVPTAALAASPDSARPAQAERGQERAAQAQDADRGRSESAASPSTSPSPAAAADRARAGAAGGAAGGAAAGRSAAAPGRTRAPQARPEQARPERARPEPKGKAAGQEKGKPAGAARTADPRGNNGTFKVDGPVLDTSHGNEPHVSCEFRLNFFGYDAGQLADISVTAIAPTRGATTRVSGLQLISSNPAKGGLYGGSYPATGTWSAVDLGLDPTQRQHVRVSVTSFNPDGSDVPGGAKSKVFWLEPCAPADQPAAVEPVQVAGGVPVFGPRAVVAVSAAAPAAVPAPASPATAVLAGSVSAQSAAPATVVAAPASLVQPFSLPPVSARASAPPAQLPFTGAPELLALLMAGVVTLAGGSALLVAVRRSS